MRTKLRNLKFVIVDEVSMVSSLNLTYMYMRLEELFNGGDKYFGTKNILLVGDILQAPPVNEKPVFDRVSQKAILHKLGSTTASTKWQEVVVMMNLSSMRGRKRIPNFQKCYTTFTLTDFCGRDWVSPTYEANVNLRLY